MKKLLTFIMAFALIAGCAKAVFVQAEETRGDAQYERTILLYDCGADLETRGGMATYNLHQILRAKFSSDDKVKFIVMTGGSDAWHLESQYLYDPQTGGNIEGISTKYNQIWEAKGIDAKEHPGQMVLLDGDGILGDGDNAKPAEPKMQNDETTGIPTMVGTPDDYEWMNDPKVLKAFINYGVENYPAEKYDLILWDHGGGPTGGFAVDEHSQNYETMSMPQIIDAISDNKLIESGGRFDFVDFDACLMSSVEYIYGLADYMQYYIVSPESEPGYGQDYEGWLNMLGENPTVDTFTLGKKIVDDFLAFYNKKEGDGAGNDGTLAVIDVDKIMNNPDNPGDPTLLDDLIQMNKIIQSELEKGDIYDEARSISYVMHYGGMNFADLGQLASQLGYTFWETDYDKIKGEEIDTRNEYTEVTQHIQLILGDKSIIYGGGTDTM